MPRRASDATPGKRPQRGARAVARGIFPAGVHDVDDLDRQRGHPVDHHVIWVYDAFARARDAAGSISARVPRQGQHGIVDALPEVACRLRTTLGDVGDDSRQIVCGGLKPGYIEHGKAGPRPGPGAIDAPQ